MSYLDDELSHYRKRFAVQILFYDCDQFILRAIENCAPFVGKIYVAHSIEPWNYNNESRSKRKNPSNVEILKLSRHFDKIELVQGVWDTEEDQRNACLQKAKADGYQFMIVQDADEFYMSKAYLENLSQILADPDYSFYVTPWIIFWKNTDYVFEFRDPGFGERNTIFARCPNFAVNLLKDVSFKALRVVNRADFKLLSGLCFHFSYVMTDEQALRKVKTWGHAHQVSKYWHKYKWLAWTRETKYLFPLNFVTVNRAVKWGGELPSEMADYPIQGQETTELGVFEGLFCRILDLKSYFVFYKNEFKRSLYPVVRKFIGRSQK